MHEEMRANLGASFGLALVECGMTMPKGLRHGFPHGQRIESSKPNRWRHLLRESPKSHVTRHKIFASPRWRATNDWSMPKALWAFERATADDISVRQVPGGWLGVVFDFV